VVITAEFLVMPFRVDFFPEATFAFGFVFVSGFMGVLFC
jgi:hypothetical protein